ncbi:MAG: hypothetical protein ACE5EY_07935, partial [Anaerolineae bacterium]
MNFTLRLLTFSAVTLLFLAACTPGAPEEEANLVLPTPIVAATIPADLAGGLPVAPTMDPNNIPRDNGETAVNPAPTATRRPKDETPTYQVAFVASDDTLNVR